MAGTWQHTTVLLNEAVDALVTKPDGTYVDATFGRGGHSRLLLSQLEAQGRLIAFDAFAVYLLEERRQSPGAAQHAARQCEQRGRLAPGLRRFPGSAGSYVHDGAERHRYDEEHKQCEKVLPRRAC